ncbi:MAG: glutamyl-tRNA reductase, partial [Bacteroidota bacterium]
AIQKLMQSRLSRKSRILLIGAGQTNALVAKFLLKHQYSQVTVFNRTLQRAVDLADKLSGSAYALEDLKSYTKGFDAIIICTGATKAFLDVELYHQLLAGETDEKLIIDLAIPHNVNPEVVKQFPVNYIEIEDIRSLAHQNLAFREQEVGRVRELLQEKLDEFGLVYRQRQIEIAMKGVPAKIKAIKSHAINSVFKKDLEGLDQDTLDLMNRMMSYMEKQCIGVPMKAARQVITK